ncbi:transposase [Halobacillus shinanisalinarum]|uniref:Transposase n=1 Tax=Halobacillus shinanisalinarum TaxID=2932258 RepID=A0ABY4H1Y6_9BACI|nr:transposase [Halobacillus shinanisalinarum]UOQ94451.1 transposase [Halobacillus shinanisalinarum]
MANPKRVWFPHASYHITSRGNRKADIFFDPSDRYYYLELLARNKRSYPFHLHAYCLMTNHVHLLIETIDHPPGIFMKELHSNYAMYFNKKYDYVGHLFQGPYKAELQDDINAMLQVSRYIHLNPCRANITSSPEEYRWSSYPHYLSKRPPNTLITTSTLLSYFKDKEEYDSFVKLPLKTTSGHP